MWCEIRLLMKIKSQESGLIMIQIDGFSKSELAKALERNEMPFLKKLIKNEKYRLHALYTGLPSTTPAVQGELFYGVKQCVPSFFFYDKPSKQVFRMFDGDSVRTIEERLSKQGEGLLEGGSSYSNIYSGGAKETHFCAGSLGWKYVGKDVNLFEFLLIVSTHFLATVRMTVLCFWETFLALMDFIYGLLKKESIAVELKFVPLRVLICILLRELITLGATMDAIRGLPIIHLNFLGYDEQAHRRSPGSQTAHWALKGIDKSIARIYSAAIKSSRRHYDVWIYSDHGQEATIPYVGLYGKSVEEAVAQVFHGLFDQKITGTNKSDLAKKTHDSIQLQRSRYLGQWVRKIGILDQGPNLALDSDLVTTAMGPLGGIYIFKELTAKQRLLFAKELVRLAKIPLVLMPQEDGKVLAWNEQGQFILPEQARDVIGADHPFFEDVLRDLIALCHHPNAGTLTISGWRPKEKPLSFPFENGAHAGPGKIETNAFALLPANVKLRSQERTYFITKDLRECALRLLKRSPEDLLSPSQETITPNKSHPLGTIRIMTYNVHGCKGLDGKVSPERIARVIGRYEPDIVVLQELDIGRNRSEKRDQPHLIAKELEMMYHFHPAIHVEEERYGNAVLSRYPMELIHAAVLPPLKNRFNSEPRGAMWVSIKVGNVRLQVINTHLSFYSHEGWHQAKALMGHEWTAHPHCKGPIILSGDFNCLPNSAAWRLINHKLRDVQRVLDKHRPKATWFGHYPIGRIDHIFISPGIKVSAIDVPRTQLNKMSSDHLPLIADLEVF